MYIFEPTAPCFKSGFHCREKSLYSSRLAHVTSAQEKTVPLLTQKGCFLVLVLLRFSVLAGKWRTDRSPPMVLLLIGLPLKAWLFHASIKADNN